MSSTVENIAILLVYALICVLSVLAYHFQLIDNTLETVILTGALGHLGIAQYPPIQGGEKK